MSTQNLFYDSNDLPSNVLTLIDDKFYDFVEQHLGMYQSLLLKIQQINSVSCFLLTDDPCHILSLSINDNELYELKKHICFQLSDGSFFVKPGVKIGFKCLHDLLTKEVEEKLKKSKNTKVQVSTTAPFNILSSSFLTPPLTTISTETIPAASQNTHSSLKEPSSTSINEHKKMEKIFFLNVAFNERNALKASVKCNCGRIITLTVKNGNIQLSNFQKHLRMTNCSHMNFLKRNFTTQKKTNLQQSSSSSSSSIDASLTPSKPTQQQSVLQVPVFVSTDASSIVSARSSNIDTTVPQTDSRKRDLELKPSSSQKIKRTRI
ncbi:unnamed protein product [Rotaria sp. Silwood2]|nr:unnamed protein product [Rotaria sp. Silwood2]CAF2993936.1 unnamed protein product [Rotaria sp. Silwood2]CAF3334373.1 unnamed protein product [Rotaria sp. Silwood2]CAF3400931.1 unnamed protein product [Rotaria sp. Silwood2]CAF4247466.1 unnamed protein product [Rotaria sp. Silwood2]